MNLFGLEGCGFILSLSVTLLLTGLTFYYFRMRCAVLEKVVQEQSKILQQFIHVSTRCDPILPHQQNGGANEIAVQSVQNINNDWNNETPMQRQDVSDGENDSDADSDSESEDNSDTDSTDTSSATDDNSTEHGKIHLQLDIPPNINISNESELQTDSIKTINLELPTESCDIITGACESLEQNEKLVTDISNLTVPALRELVVEHTDISEKEAKKLLKPALKELLEPIVNN